MSILTAMFSNKVYCYEDAFGAVDCTSSPMREAIDEWFRLFYMDKPTDTEDPCQRIPYTVVNKIVKTMFGEYTVLGTNDFSQSLLHSLDAVKKPAVQTALIGGECFLKPVPMGDRFFFSVIPRNHILIFGKDVEGNPTDIGISECAFENGAYYTLLERRTIGPDGLLTIHNNLYRSEMKGSLGQWVPLTSLRRYQQLTELYTFPEPVGLGLIRIKTPLANCVDGSSDGVSVYGAAVGLIHNINRNEFQLNGEFERGESRIIVSSDMLGQDASGHRKLKDHVFVGLDDNPEEVGITPFSPALREASFLARKTEYLRNVENVIGMKRGLLSDVEAAEKTATEITSSAGDYNLTIIEFQEMWEQAVKSAAVLCGKLGRLYQIPSAYEIHEDDISIDWGNGILFDEDKTWTDYKAMVAAGLLKPEIAVGWRFNMPAETESDLAKIRERYMPVLESMTDGDT